MSVSTPPLPAEPQPHLTRLVITPRVPLRIALTVYLYCIRRPKWKHKKTKEPKQARKIDLDEGTDGEQW